MDVLLIAAARARLLAVFAGLAWVLGLEPTLWTRLAMLPAVAIAIALDIYADRAAVPGAIRVTTLKGTDR